MFRGGAYPYAPWECRAAYRWRLDTHAHRSGTLGFRVVCEVTGKTSPRSGDFALRFQGKDSVGLPSMTYSPTGPLTIEVYVDAGRTTHPDGYALVELPSGRIGMWGGYGPLWCQVGQSILKTGAPKAGMNHVAAVRTSEELRLFVNGKCVGAQKASPRINPRGAGIMGRLFFGMMREVRISKSARYDKDFTPAKRFEPDADTLALYHFDEGAGNVLHDSSGHANHGHIVGASWVMVEGPPAKAGRPAQEGTGQNQDNWQYGDIRDLRVARPEDKEDVKSVPPPRNAVVLFDGKSLDKWVQRSDGLSHPHWKLLPGGIIQASGGDIHTVQKFAGPYKLHLEFRVPYLPDRKGQARGNSGVYIQGRYEVQILDSYGLHSTNRDCGAVFSIAARRVNACKAPGVWQSYDLEFSPPRGRGGRKQAPGRITVYHNGVKIHDGVELTRDNTDRGMAGDPSSPGPILLQDHGDPVQLRNIWLLNGE